MEERDELMEIERRSGTYLVGMEQGRRVTLIDLILTVLEVRGIEVDPEAAARVRACDSLATLERWAQAVRSVTQTAELFG